MAVEMFRVESGADMIHVPYKGSGPAMTDLVGGQVLMAAETVPAALQQIKAGKLRALAVTTPQRISMLPDVPTVNESGWKDFDVVSTFGVLAPAGTPADVMARLNTEVGKLMQDPAAKEQFLQQGVYALPPQTQQQAAGRLQAEVAKWSRVIDQTGVKADE
jgi:tripartite-type tricarboxylate transporter receptor subunit TctC